MRPHKLAISSEPGGSNGVAFSAMVCVGVPDRLERDMTEFQPLTSAHMRPCHWLPNSARRIQHGVDFLRGVHRLALRSALDE